MHRWSFGSLWWASAWVSPDAWAALARGGGPELRGIYAAIEVSADGSVRAFADPLGFRLVYYGETSELVAIGSNATLVAQALHAKGLGQLRVIRSA